MFFRRKPTILDQLREALAQAEAQLLFERDRAAYHQALANLNPDQIAADRHTALADYREQMTIFYRAQIDALERGQPVTMPKKEQPCPDLVFTSPAPASSSIAFGQPLTAS